MILPAGNKICPSWLLISRHSVTGIIFNPPLSDTGTCGGSPGLRGASGSRAQPRARPGPRQLVSRREPAPRHGVGVPIGGGTLAPDSCPQRCASACEVHTLQWWGHSCAGAWRRTTTNAGAVPRPTGHTMVRHASYPRCHTWPLLSSRCHAAWLACPRGAYYRPEGRSRRSARPSRDRGAT